jgi:hypothetical protein
MGINRFAVLVCLPILLFTSTVSAEPRDERIPIIIQTLQKNYKLFASAAEQDIAGNYVLNLDAGDYSYSVYLKVARGNIDELVAIKELRGSRYEAAIEVWVEGVKFAELKNRYTHVVDHYISEFIGLGETMSKPVQFEPVEIWEEVWGFLLSNKEWLYKRIKTSERWE